MPPAPATLGPDLLYAQTIKVNADSYSGSVAAGKWKGTVYIQGYVQTPNGGRLTSMVECHPNEALINPPAPSISFPLPIDAQQTLRPQKKGYDLVAQPVRLGIPLPKGAIFEKAGVPQLTLTGGAKEGQFSTMAKWSDGSCKWVLAEFRADVAAGQLKPNIAVDRGAGNFRRRERRLHRRLRDDGPTPARSSSRSTPPRTTSSSRSSRAAAT
jgi:hypothetical protein